MNLKCTLLMILQFIEIWSYRKSEYVIKHRSDCKSRDFYPQKETYTFSATTNINCNFRFSVPFYYRDRQYCIHANNVYIDSCAVTLQIYRGPTLLKMTLSCRKKVMKPFCIAGSSSSITIKYRATKSSNSVIKLQILPEPRPATTTESYDKNVESATSNNALVGILVFAGVFLVMIMAYFCCCRKTTNEDEAEEPVRSVNNNPQLSAPMIEASAPTRSDIRSSTHDLYSNTYAQDPPEYTTVTSSSLIQPSAPTLDSHQEDKEVPPPSYEDAVGYMTSTQ